MFMFGIPLLLCSLQCGEGDRFFVRYDVGSAEATEKTRWVQPESITLTPGTFPTFNRSQVHIREPSAAHELTLGYQFTPQWAVKVAFADLGDWQYRQTHRASETDDADRLNRLTISRVESDWDIQVWSLSLEGGFHLPAKPWAPLNRVRLFGEAGISRWRSDGDGTAFHGVMAQDTSVPIELGSDFPLAPTAEASFSQDGDGVRIGGGLSVDLGKGFAVSFLANLLYDLGEDEDLALSDAQSLLPSLPLARELSYRKVRFGLVYRF